MQVQFFCPRWGSEQYGWDDFLTKVKEEGYDGVEYAIAGSVSRQELDVIWNSAERQNMRILVQHYDTCDADFHRHFDTYSGWLQKMKDYPMVKLNSQTGRDFFNFQQNSALIAAAAQCMAGTGIGVVHESHRGKFSFAAHVTKEYLEKIPTLHLTLDASHWVNVSETFLEDQAGTMDLAIERARHIHARVGYPEGPQISDPRLPEWQHALDHHLVWWDAVAERHRQDSTLGTLTITPEFGPYPYMGELPFTRQPITSQWEVNAWMMRLLKKRYMTLCCWLLLFISVPAFAHEYHVAVNGMDEGPGTAEHPFRTINRAAQLAQPGDTVTVHAGTYREQVSPARGGTSDMERILYRAAPNEKVEIKGSEIVKDWQPLQNGVWKVILPDSVFGNYNPYTDLITGDWYFGKNLHTGEVYLDGKSLHEVKALEKVSDTYTWYCTYAPGQTTIYANFHGQDPNKALVEINMRTTCFCPAETGRNYITVRGFDMSQAATQWAAPTAEQIGIVATNWSMGWIIENNVIHDSKCVGITLGKDRASGQNVWSKDPSRDGSILYNEMAQRVAANGWSRATIGSHLVRGNTVHDCGAAGICGSFGAAYSRILDNNIYDIYTYRPYWGAEMGGIKIHAAIDVLIRGNKVHNCYQGIWLDWMAQGTRISGNLCYNNDFMDFFPEVDHGPYLVDNNLFLSGFSIKDWSEGGAYVHNLIAGMVSRAPQARATPFFKPHTTQYAGSVPIKGGDTRWYNNIFCGTGGKPPFQKTRYLPDDAVDPSSGYGLSMYDSATLPTHAAGNVYLYGALPARNEQGTVSTDLWQHHCAWVTTALLGKALIPDAAYENPDGSPLKIDVDYLGKVRSKKDLVPGPFAQVETSEFVLIYLR